MPIVGSSDKRRIIHRFDGAEDITKEPLPSITAIDSRFQNETISFNGFGTGIVISPNYVLTAAHVLYSKGDIDSYQTDIRVTSSNQQKDLNGRFLGTNLEDSGNVDLADDLPTTCRRVYSFLLIVNFVPHPQTVLKKTISILV